MANTDALMRKLAAAALEKSAFTPTETDFWAAAAGPPGAALSAPEGQGTVSLLGSLAGLGAGYFLGKKLQPTLARRMGTRLGGLLSRYPQYVGMAGGSLLGARLARKALAARDVEDLSQQYAQYRYGPPNHYGPPG